MSEKSNQDDFGEDIDFSKYISDFEENLHSKFNKNKFTKILLRKIFLNAYMISILLGIIYSLTGLPFPTLLNNILESLSGAVFPLALISLGLFAAEKKIIDCSWKQLIIYYFMRMIFSPAVALLVAFILGIKGEEGQILVITFCLPLALMSYILSTQYNLSPGIYSTQIIIQNFLMIPSFFLWFAILRSIPFFS
ncbi:auxin efflux carrier component 1b-related [Anaeramoeba ignava]|uniref:Auxin efflux carrier component 1b-related n=1 Tax=Anaeramoeba ignava TaxID=1746090 RepID=A0A9Q0LKI1_ANAIG|nr:auxin efflux carrier component 1b-related [Anaeramoeba ignava]